MRAENVCNIISMYKNPEIVKHQRGKLMEPETNPVLTNASSLAQLSEFADLLELRSLEQSIEFQEPPTLESQEPLTAAKHWKAIDRKPLPSIPTLSHWQSELREIQQECEYNIWKSCPYD